MANKLYVTELAGYAGIGSYVGPWMPTPIGTGQILTIGGNSVQSAALSERAKAILLVSDTACCIAIGSDPIADNTKGPYLPANYPMIFTVGAGTKVACISA